MKKGQTYAFQVFGCELMCILVIKEEINLIPNKKSALLLVMVRMILATAFGIMKKKDDL